MAKGVGCCEKTFGVWSGKYDPSCCRDRRRALRKFWVMVVFASTPEVEDKNVRKEKPTPEKTREDKRTQAKLEVKTRQEQRRQKMTRQDKTRHDMTRDDKHRCFYVLLLIEDETLPRWGRCGKTAWGRLDDLRSIKDKTRHDKRRQEKTRQYKTREHKTREDSTRQDKTRQEKTRQHDTSWEKTSENKTR